MRQWLWISLVAALLLTAGTERAAGEDDGPTLEALQATVKDDGNARKRSDAAGAIARSYYEPKTLVPWLRERLAAEGDSHVKLALGYALAAQGEKDGLHVLVDALERTGHLGYVYLTRVSDQDFGGPGVGWNHAAWVKWLAALDAEAFRDLQRKSHLPRTATDADAAGLEKAIAWWKTLGLPDVTKRAFGRVYPSWGVDGDEASKAYELGFLLRQRKRDLQVFGTDLRRVEYLRKSAKGKLSARFEKADIKKELAAALDRFEVPRGRGRDMFDGTPWDPFGVDFYLSTRRGSGLLLAIALHAQGAKDVALRVWRHIASHPGGAPEHGPWSGLALVKQDMRRAMLIRWEESLLEKGRSWAKSLAAFKAWRAFHGDATDVWETETEAALVTMAGQEGEYAAAARGGKGTPEERAKRLVLALPTMRRSWNTMWNTETTEEPKRKDAYARLIDLGAAAAPALIAALDDARLTKSVRRHHGGKAYIRESFDIVRVQEAALMALRVISSREFGARGASREEVRKEVDAWWKQLSTLGESGVLIEGVKAADRSSPAQARLLVKRFPALAFAPIKAAFDAAESDGVATDLILALRSLKRPEVQAFLLELAAAGEIDNRIAAAKALHSHGSKKGVRALRSAWPAEGLVKTKGPAGLGIDLGSEPVRGLAETLLFLDPIGTLTHMRAALDKTSPRLKYEILAKIHAALGYTMFFSPDREPEKKRSPKIHKAVEAFLIDMVLDKSRREGQVFAFGPGQPNGPQTNAIGEAAAAKLAHIWTKRYAFDGRAGKHERLEQRFAIVNIWLKAHGKPAIAPPERFEIKPLAKAQVQPALDAWLATAAGTAREEAAAAIVKLGLGTLPTLEAARRASKDAAAKERLDALVRRVARIVREVIWRKEGPKPNAAMKTLVDGLLGTAIQGSDVTNLFRQFHMEPTEGATGISFEFTRPGDGTGYVLTFGMTTHRVPWPGGQGGYILGGDGRELVDHFLEDRSSWWHKSRGGQIHKILDQPKDKEVRLSRSFVRVK